jgi:hypothetical protein
MNASSETSHPHALDRRAVQRAVQRMAAAAQPPWLHAEAARRMADRLPMIRRTPEAVLQWSGFLGASDALLREAYPKAQQHSGVGIQVQRGRYPAGQLPGLVVAALAQPPRSQRHGQQQVHGRRRLAPLGLQQQRGQGAGEVQPFAELELGDHAAPGPGVVQSGDATLER